MILPEVSSAQLLAAGPDEHRACCRQEEDTAQRTAAKELKERRAEAAPITAQVNGDLEYMLQNSFSSSVYLQKQLCSQRCHYTTGKGKISFIP